MLYQVQGALRELYFMESFEEVLLDLSIQVLTGSVKGMHPNSKKDCFTANVV